MSDLPLSVAKLAGRSIVKVQTPTEHFDTFDGLHAFTSLRLLLDDGTALTLTPGHEYKKSHTAGYKTVTVDCRDMVEALPVIEIKERHEQYITRLNSLDAEMNALGEVATSEILRGYESRILAVFREAQSEIPLLENDGVTPSAMTMADVVRERAGKSETLRCNLVSQAHTREIENARPASI